MVTQRADKPLASFIAAQFLAVLRTVCLGWTGQRSEGRKTVSHATEVVVGEIVPRGYAAGRGAGLRGRLVGVLLAISVQVLLVLLLLSLGWVAQEPEKVFTSIVSFDAREESTTEPDTPEEAAPPEADEEAAPQPQAPESEQAAPEQPAPEITTPQAVPTPPPPIVFPLTPPAASPPPAPRPAPSPSPTAPARVYGPPDTGSQPGSDSERVGTAPNGEPLYAARWYREPRPGELAGYLSTADGPGSALIACRTAPDFRVEDCVLIGETPAGSRIGSAVIGASWQFRVRPARVGGRSLVGSWVRIRIDYRRSGIGAGS